MLKDFEYVSADWENRILLLASGALECAIASAYFSTYGVSFLQKLSERLINSLNQEKIVNIKVVLSSNFSESPEERTRILNTLVELPNVEARIFCEKKLLHCKNYIFKTDDEVRALVGSTNLTSSGFFHNVETGTLAVHELDDPEAKTLLRQFDQMWMISKPVKEFFEAKQMSDVPKYHEGENVKYISTGKIGTINKVIPSLYSYSYRVTIDGKSKTIPERFLEACVDEEDNLIEDFIKGNFGDHTNYRLFQTWFRLSKPLDNNLYSYLGSKTLFNPHQFKPLIRFISPNSDERLFIADEVGVGKTIETGIILLELLARERLTYNTPILIVCPNALTIKWANELKNRFRLDFEILDGDTLHYMLQAFLQDGVCPKKYNFSIVGLQLLRRKENLRLLEELESKRDDSPFGMVVVDEAHHMRNQGTDSNTLGNVLSDSAEMMLMLSATPLNLSSDDLYNQMHILNPNLFQDKSTFEALYSPVIQLNKMRRLLSHNSMDARKQICAEYRELEREPLGKIISQHREIHELIQRLSAEHIFSPEELVKYDRLLVSLNPLYYSFTRTRKREAFEHQVYREVLEIPITLSKAELAFQNHALEVIQESYVMQGGNPQILGFITNTYRRMISSCIPAMKGYLEWSILKNKVYLAEPQSNLEDPEDDSEFNTVELDPYLKVAFEKLLHEAECLSGADSKYDQFKRTLVKILSNPETPQVIVFSFFIRTLEYLKERLEEDGLSVGIIHGAVPLKGDNNRLGRYEIMEAFKRKEFDILLSSEVGGEGLDFQYCHAVINYDLPYNPMRIEQRIGRIDRFGQTAKKIIIANLFIEGTIDEEIYDRLYRRINLIQDGIGALEPIMGKEISDIQTAVICGNLTEEQKEQLSKRLEEAIVAAKIEHEAFETYKKELLSDDFLTRPINAITTGDFITPEDVMQLTEHYISKCEGCSFARLTTGGGVIETSAKLISRLETFCRKPGNEGAFPELHRLLQKTQKKIHVVFDGSIAESLPESVFLPPTGYWARFLTSEFEQEPGFTKAFKFSITASDHGLPAGKYIIFLFEVRMEGLRTEIEFLGVPVEIDSRSVKPLNLEKLPRILASADSDTIPQELVDIDVNELLDTAREYLDRIIDDKRRSASEENRFKIESRITALTESSEKRTHEIQKQIERHCSNREYEGKAPDEDYLRLANARIVKERSKLESKIQELEKHQDLSLDYSLEAIVYTHIKEARR